MPLISKLPVFWLLVPFDRYNLVWLFIKRQLGMNQFTRLTRRSSVRAFGVEVQPQAGPRNSSVMDRPKPKPCNKRASKPSESCGPSPPKPTLMQIEQEPTSPGSCQLAQYLPDIVTHLLSTELRHPPIGNYFSRQPDISVSMRSVLLVWLLDVHTSLKLFPQTLHLAVALIDRHLEKERVSRGQLQLVGITALWIAAKCEQIYSVPKVSYLTYLCEQAYKVPDVLEMQGRILSSISFDLLKTTPLYYLELFRAGLCPSDRDFHLQWYLLELALLDFSMNKYAARQVAAAAYYFVRKIRNVVPCWSEEFERQTNCAEGELRSCAKDLCCLLQNAQTCQYLTPVREKFSAQQFLEVGKIKIAERSK